MISLCSKANYNIPADDIHTGMHTMKVVQDITQVKEVWSRYIQYCHPLDYERLLAIQNSMADQFSFYYVLLKNNSNEVIGLQYFQYLPFRAKYFDSPFKSFTISAYLEKLLVNNRFRMLICGSLFSVNAPGYFFTDSTISNSDQYKMLVHTADTLLQSLQRCEVIFKDVGENLRDFFVSSHYHSFDDDVTMTMQIRPEWNTLQDYISDLKHKYAQRARKLMKAAAIIDRRELSADEIEKYAPEVNRLFLQVVNNQSIRLGIPDDNYFVEMKKQKPDTFSVCGYFLNNQLVAFASYIVNHQNDELHYIGFEYTLNKTHYLYFNILYDGISKAIQNKIEILELGRTAREAKAVVGAVPVTFHSYIRFSSSVSRWVYEQLKKRFRNKTETDLKNRHPFKNK